MITIGKMRLYMYYSRLSSSLVEKFLQCALNSTSVLPCLYDNPLKPLSNSCNLLPYPPHVAPIIKFCATGSTLSLHGTLIVIIFRAFALAPRLYLLITTTLLATSAISTLP